jgi:hypothetical protein
VSRRIGRKQWRRIAGPLDAAGYQDGVDCLVLVKEHLKGESIAHHLKKGPLPPDQV